MTRIVMWLASTATIVALLFGYKTSTQGALDLTTAEGVQSPAISSGSASDSQGSSAQAGSGSSGSSSSDSTQSNSSSGSDSSGNNSSGSGSSSAGRVLTGDSIFTRYGPVQVELTVKGATITEIRMLAYPYNSPRDQQINTQALPILISETLDAQSSNIDMVSGATYTSQGYVQSLQSALDQV
jgi:uncharacterized protein with FMN-binding domain